MKEKIEQRIAECERKATEHINKGEYTRHVEEKFKAIGMREALAIFMQGREEENETNRRRTTTKIL